MENDTNIESPVVGGIKYLPQTVTDVDTKLGGNTKELLPPIDEIPEDFKRWGNPWNQFQSYWFFKGLDRKTQLHVREGIDPNQAIRHLMAIQVSYEPKHEHKSAGVAYLASLWFTKVVVPAPGGDKVFQDAS